MRLLHIDDRDRLSFTRDFYDYETPEYAILSHTWGIAEEEISFEEFLDGPDKRKSGYAKMKACGRQAKRDGFEYFWIDTCCIDKRSSAELSEAINSMCRWYQKARICYAYLSDVSFTDDWCELFQQSVWFTRGWTLQELLAPSTVRFFDRGWCPFGDKIKLADMIESTTKIPKAALMCSFNELPRHFSVAQRMSWAAARQTSRVEDIAYCLMGLFDINMPLLYGEGSKAFGRLQEEIVKTSSDETIFAWKASPKSSEKPARLLAPHPSYFRDYSNVVMQHAPGISKQYFSEFWTTDPRVTDEDRQLYEKLYETRLPFVMTHRGLQITGRLLGLPGSLCQMMMINCSRQSESSRPLVLTLLGGPDDYFYCGCVSLTKEQVQIYADCKLPPPCTIFILQREPDELQLFSDIGHPRQMVDHIFKWASSSTDNHSKLNGST